MKPVGQPIPRRPLLIFTAESGLPGFGWALSDEARKEIEALEENRRLAMQRSREIILD